MIMCNSNLPYCSHIAWNFAAEERLKGCTQIIDVTDDCTGEPHRLAREHIPMVRTEFGLNISSF